MSTKKTLIAIAALVVCIGGPLYFQHQVKTRVNNFKMTVDKLENALPEGLKQEHTQEVGWFSSSGVYTILEARPDSDYSPVGVVSYEIKHGLGDIFSKYYNVSMDMDVNWSNLGNFIIPDTTTPYFKFQGKYFKDGNFEMDGVAQDLVWKSEDAGTEMKTKGNTMRITYDKNSELSVIDHKIEKIYDEAAGEEFNNLRMVYQYNADVDNRNLFSVDYSLDSVKQGYAEFKGVNFHMNLSEKGSYLDSDFRVKVDSVTSVIAGDKDFSFDMEMAINRLDNRFHKKILSLGEQDDVSEKDKVEALKLFHEMIDNGFGVNINKLKIKASEDSLDASVKFNFKKKDEINDTFVKRSSLESNVLFVSPFVTSAINVVPPELRSLMTGKLNEVKVNFLYDAGNVQLNGSKLGEEYGEFITEWLKSWEDQIEELKTMQFSEDDKTV